jgi:hypothetical protein
MSSGLLFGVVVLPAIVFGLAYYPILNRLSEPEISWRRFKTGGVTSSASSIADLGSPVDNL